MKLDFAIVLCAGHGTRMGKLSKHLPKPLWPFFNYSLLTFQIMQLRKLGVKKIYINTHNQKEKIHLYLESLQDIDIKYFYEPELLGSGGAITNILSHHRDPSGNFIVVNSDAFIHFKPNQLSQLSILQKSHNKILLAMPNEEKNYNQLYFENNYLKAIKKPNGGDYYTYTGFGLFNIAGIKIARKYSNFFDTVANYQKSDVFIYQLDKSQHFDFGTYDLFYSHLMGLDNDCPLNKFLLQNKINFNDYLIGDKSYCFDQKNIISNKNLKSDQVVILKLGNIYYDKPGIYYQDFMS